jgi:hypothetical protein
MEAGPRDSSGITADAGPSVPTVTPISGNLPAPPPMDAGTPKPSAPDAGKKK